MDDDKQWLNLHNGVGNIIDPGLKNGMVEEAQKVGLQIHLNGEYVLIQRFSEILKAWKNDSSKMIAASVHLALNAPFQNDSSYTFYFEAKVMKSLHLKYDEKDERDTCCIAQLVLMNRIQELESIINKKYKAVSEYHLCVFIFDMINDLYCIL